MVREIRVIGVDHGIHHTGYGVLKKTSDKIVCLDQGSIDTSPNEPFPQRLQKIYNGLFAVIQNWRPDTMAVEEAIYAQNIHTALMMGHARGVVLLAGVNSGVEICEYAPKKIKSSVVGNGNATKEQVRFMVSRILGIDEKSLQLDASDALAAAICHLNQNRLINS
ncbi:MAG: crossover junction endodeoxyribonuclease RuvC [Candidatus Marinimicrobia bacterium CG08_land_8_20_14_0_20_45_22]|nr:MAG: crossover junction endodeoxyribonuclease RuvC [Candidatus Marinimicrobia bacterium CG08_land_8_20_14_0_20_45_22]